MFPYQIEMQEDHILDICGTSAGAGNICEGEGARRRRKKRRILSLQESTKNVKVILF
jgi:hypothetical protein